MFVFPARSRGTVPRSSGAALDFNAADIKLTDLASCGGCAAKYSAARLEELLAGFVQVEEENLLVGLGTPDDAAVYKLDDERAIIFTLDFFPPIVDEPGDYGAIAATNALNDVFAMGGTPLLALSIAAFPEELPMEMLGEIFSSRGRDRAQGGRAARRRPHDPRRRAQVRPRRGRDGAPGGDLDEGGRAAGRRALPDEAARHGTDHDRPQEGHRARSSSSAPSAG